MPPAAQLRLPQLLPTPGAWLLVSQGPYVGTVMWPQAERSRCLFAEGGKTTHGLLIQPHLGAPGSAAGVCPGCPALITQGGGPGASKGVAGQPHRSPRSSKKRLGPLTLQMAAISALE